MRYKNRKASLELSIRAIVIVILAMTLLGLGLGFIRTMFKDISGITTDVSEQIRQQILDDLITNDKRVSFPKTQILIDKGGSEIIMGGMMPPPNMVPGGIASMIIGGPMMPMMPMMSILYNLTFY